jgi:hypothetical protein
MENRQFIHRSLSGDEMFSDWHVRKIRSGVIQRVRIENRKPAEGKLCKFTDEEVCLILKLKPSGNCYQKALALGHLLGVSATTISDIWARRTYKHLGAQEPQDA